MCGWGPGGSRERAGARGVATHASVGGVALVRIADAGRTQSLMYWGQREPRESRGRGLRRRWWRFEGHTSEGCDAISGLCRRHDRHNRASPDSRDGEERASCGRLILRTHPHRPRRFGDLAGGSSSEPPRTRTRMWRAGTRSGRDRALAIGPPGADGDRAPLRGLSQFPSLYRA